MIKKEAYRNPAPEIKEFTNGRVNLNKKYAVLENWIDSNGNWLGWVSVKRYYTLGQATRASKQYKLNNKFRFYKAIVVKVNIINGGYGNFFFSYETFSGRKIKLFWQ